MHMQRVGRPLVALLSVCLPGTVCAYAYAHTCGLAAPLAACSSTPETPPDSPCWFLTLFESAGGFLPARSLPGVVTGQEAVRINFVLELGKTCMQMDNTRRSCQVYSVEMVSGPPLP